MADNVNSPSHYTHLPHGVEVIDLTEGMGFCLGNVIKYVMRCDHKGKPVEDLKKARWYLDREIARREGAEPIGDETASAPMCRARYRSFVCTEPARHIGDHIAGGPRGMVCETWAQ